MFGDDRYTYPHSGGVLVNRFGIRDSAELDRVVNTLVSFASGEIARDDNDIYDLDYLRSIHRRMFGDIFDWAGEFRTTDVHAAGTDIHYLAHAEVGPRAERLFDELAEQDYLRGLDSFEFCMRLARHWGELARIHPFRDGNTRSQTLYVARLARDAGHPIDWSRVDVEHLRGARLSATQGFTINLETYLADRLVPAHDPDPDPVEIPLSNWGKVGQLFVRISKWHDV